MAQLDFLLDAVAEALMAGDFATLSQLSPQIESIDLGAVDPGTAESLRAKAQRNARLIEAASRGVKAARLRMSEITQGPELVTYNAHGQKAQISIQVREPARRA